MSPESGVLAGTFPAYMSAQTSSFSELLHSQAPSLLPARSAHPLVVPAAHGTTVLAVHYRDGVLLAGDRRATIGHQIARHDLRKIERADRDSGVAFAGTVGVARSLVALFQVELEHYEKMEGVELSLPAKVNRVSALVRGNLSNALQDLAVVPLYAGWDREQRRGRIFTFDITGSPAEEQNYGGAGSGWLSAKSALKKLHRPDQDRAEALHSAVQSLFDAADEDTATGGPDVSRRIYPIAATITEDGYAEIGEQDVAAIVPELRV